MQGGTDDEAVRLTQSLKRAVCLARVSLLPAARGICAWEQVCFQAWLARYNDRADKFNTQRTYACQTFAITIKTYN